MNNKDWIKVYSSTFSHLAEIAKGILEANDIKSVILNKKDSAYTFGEVELYALAEQADEALDILKKAEL